MYIPNGRWDDINAECAELIEKIEAIPPKMVYPWRTDILALLYDILHLQDAPLPLPEPYPSTD